MDRPPTTIRALSDQRVFEIGWGAGSPYRVPFRVVRGRCCCAVCVDENTGRRIVDVADVAEDVAPEALACSGNYALKVTWSDGHDSGLYTWNYLRQLCELTSSSD